MDIKNFLIKLNIDESHHNYFKNIKKFIDIYFPTITDYKEIFRQIISNDAYEYRYFCYHYLEQYTKKIESFKITSDTESVLLIFEEYPHIEIILRNTINKLPSTWSHTIFCCVKNYEFIKKMVSTISNDIKIICYNGCIDTLQDYNKLMVKSDFWNSFNGNKLLLYNELSMVLGNNIDDFMDYDFIGAPWKQEVNLKCVGNGSFSIRNKKIMLEIIEKYKPRETEYSSVTDIMNHILLLDDYNPPEDVYFTTNMIKYNIGKIPDKDIAKTFSVESVFYEYPFGFHECYIANKNKWRDYLYGSVVINFDYYNFDKELWKANYDTYDVISKETNKNNFHAFCIYNGFSIIKTNNDDDIKKYFAINNVASDNDNNNLKSEKTFGFIITRHISSKKTNKYWLNSYKCIRKYYPNNLIIIIDDHSNNIFLDENPLTESKYHKSLHNLIIINSTLPNCCGELLPYYYYYKYKFFDKAIILHDSMFMNQHINFDTEEYDNIFVFNFLNSSETYSNHEDTNGEQFLLKQLKNNSHLLDLHMSYSWKGCFGACTVITHNFLNMLEQKYNLTILVNFIKKRIDRCKFERIIAVLFYAENHEKLNIQVSVGGYIVEHYKAFSYTYDEYINGENLGENYKIIKVWSGR